MESLCHEALGPTDAKLKILYINPNSTISFTQETVEYLRDRLPADVLMDFFTPSSAAPPSIDGTADGVLSSAAVMQEMGLTGPSRKAVAEAICKRYSAIIVSCFSAHPLVPSLKEVLASIQTQPPVLGIFEAGVYTCLQLGHTFGIATTGLHWEPMFLEHLRTLGISSDRITGVRGTGFNAISLHGEGPFDALLKASLDLVKQGANSVLLGCAGMAPMTKDLERAIEAATSKHISVVDGVESAVGSAISMARMGLRI